VAAIFSVVEAVLLRPLPYRDAGRIVTIAARAAPQTGLIEHPFSAGGYWHFARNARSFESFGGYLASGTRWRVPLIGADTLGLGVAHLATRAIATARGRPGVGIRLLEGRGFTIDDYSPDYSSTAFIVSAAVKRRYWSNESALGKRLVWGRMSGPIVGVMDEVRHRGLSTAPDEIVHSAQLGRELTIVMKVDGAWEPLVLLVRATVTAMDPDVRVTRVETMEPRADPASSLPAAPRNAAVVVSPTEMSDNSRQRSPPRAA
jgi:hypothetical protein